MCRWLAYSGSPVRLEELLYKPQNSLIIQSLHSRLGAEATNGDGVGVGWYGEHRDPGRLPQHRAGVERPQPARPGRAHRLAARARAHPCLHRVAGAADELPSVPARAVAVDAQRVPRRLRRDEARPRAGCRPRPVPRDRGFDRLRAVLLPGPDLRAGRGPARRRGPRGRLDREDRRAARRGLPGADDGGDHRRRDRSGRSGTPAKAGRARCSTAPTSRPCATSTPTTRCCTGSRTTPVWWCPSRWATSGARGARCRSPRA